MIARVAHHFKAVGLLEAGDDWQTQESYQQSPFIPAQAVTVWVYECFAWYDLHSSLIVMPSGIRWGHVFTTDHTPHFILASRADVPGL